MFEPLNALERAQMAAATDPSVRGPLMTALLEVGAPRQRAAAQLAVRRRARRRLGAVSNAIADVVAVTGLEGRMLEATPPAGVSSPLDGGISIVAPKMRGLSDFPERLT